MSAIPTAQARLIAGVRYELDGRMQLYTFAEDVSSELISRITDGHYRGRDHPEPRPARVYNTTLRGAHSGLPSGAIWSGGVEQQREDRATWATRTGATP